MSVSTRLGVENKGILYSIGSLTLPKGCSEFSYKEQDLSDKDSGRAMNGKMWKGYIGTINSYSIKFSGLLPSVLHSILDEIHSNPNGFNISWFDFNSMNYLTSEVYAGDRNINVIQFFNNHELAGLAFNLIDVSPRDLRPQPSSNNQSQSENQSEGGEG